MRVLLLLFVSLPVFASNDCGLRGTGLMGPHFRPGTLYAVRSRLRIEFKNGEELSAQMESNLDQLAGAIAARNLNFRVTFNPVETPKTLTVAFSIAEPKTPKFDETKPVYQRVWNVQTLADGTGRLVPRKASVSRIDPTRSPHEVETQVKVLMYGEGIRLPN